MFDLTGMAVPHTLRRLRAVLPPPPARVVEAGCGRGALAAALGRLGYQVTGIDPDPDACAVAAARGVPVRQCRLTDVDADAGQPHDVVLFTRSLHHVEELAGTCRHALALLRPGGLVVLEEFAREQVDRPTAGFLYDTRRLLVAAGVLAPAHHVHHAHQTGHDGHDEPPDPDGDPLDRWERDRGTLAPEPLHTGEAMLAALRDAGATVEPAIATDTLWRMVAPPGSRWRIAEADAAALVDDVRRTECRRIAEGTLRAVGMVVAARRGDR